MDNSGYNKLLQVIIITLLGYSLVGCSQIRKDTFTAKNKDVPVIELSGSGYERGLQHGRILKNEIAVVYSRWKQNLSTDLKRDADSLISEFINATNFEPAIKNRTPELLEEIKGIAYGSGQKYNDVYAFQLVDELWVFIDSISNSKREHCSCIGVSSTKNHPAYTAQNMDLENYMNGYQVLLHIHGSTEMPEQYLLTCAGLIVTTGMNEYGISVNPNSLMELQSSSDGLPVAYVIRGILAKHNFDEVLSFINSIKFASGQNYVIGMQDSIYDFETSATQIRRFYPKKEQNGIVYHTNHALVNHNIKPWYQNYHNQIMAGETKNMNSEMRFSTLERRLDMPLEEISGDIIKSTLRSKDNEKHPICRTFKEGDVVFTFGSAIYTLTGKRSVQVTKGSPDQAEYKEHFFAK